MEIFPLKISNYFPNLSSLDPSLAGYCFDSPKSFIPAPHSATSHTGISGKDHQNIDQDLLGHVQKLISGTKTLLKCIYMCIPAWVLVSNSGVRSDHPTKIIPRARNVVVCKVLREPSITQCRGCKENVTALQKELDMVVVAASWFGPGQLAIITATMKSELHQQILKEGNTCP